MTCSPWKNSGEGWRGGKHRKKREREWETERDSRERGVFKYASHVMALEL